MPSPLGHALGGMAAGWLVAGDRPMAGFSGATERARGPAAAGTVRSIGRALRAGAPYAAIGMAPDLDLLVGLHSMYTHSVGAVAVVTGAAWVLRGRRSVRWVLACGAALASHILLDWLGSDTTAPIGIMALWPFSPDYYQSSLSVFPAVSRRFSEWSFVVQNAKAAVFELLVLGPAVALIAWARREGRRAGAD